MLSAVFAGVGGSLYAQYLTVVSPLTFQMYYSTTMLIIVLGGGAGTIPRRGPRQPCLRRAVGSAAHHARSCA